MPQVLYSPQSVQLMQDEGTGNAAAAAAEEEAGQQQTGAVLKGVANTATVPRISITCFDWYMQEQLEQAAEEEEGQQQTDAVPKSVANTAMVPRAVALAKATAAPLPSSPADAVPQNPPARSSGNAQVTFVLTVVISMV